MNHPILDFRFESRDLWQTLTVREFLRELLWCLWEEEDQFSGKRPFGNSVWKRDLHAALIKAGYTSGELDENGFIGSCDNEHFERLMFDVIHAL